MLDMPLDSSGPVFEFQRAFFVVYFIFWGWWLSVMCVLGEILCLVIVCGCLMCGDS